MLNILNQIALISDLAYSQEGQITMMVDRCRGRAILCAHSWILSLLIAQANLISAAALRECTLLLAGHPDTHDYALQLYQDAAWLCCSYEKITYEKINYKKESDKKSAHNSRVTYAKNSLQQNRGLDEMTLAIEKHLALTRYVQNKIRADQKV